MSTSTVPFAQSGSGGTLRVSQAAHGFTQGQAIQLNGATWALAKSDAADTLGVGLADVIDANTFRVVHSGTVNGLAGLTAGEYYYVSSTTAGALTSTEPITGFSNPILLATSATAGVVLPYRPSGVGVAAKSVLHGYQNTTQTTNLATTDHIKFDAIHTQSGSDIGLDTTSPYTNGAGASVGRISLKGGRTYRLSANVRCVITTAGSDYVITQWYDVTNSITIGSTSLHAAAFSAMNNTPQSVVEAIYTPTSDCLVEVRNQGVVGTLTQIYASSVTVEAIGSVVAPVTQRHEVKLHTQGGWASTNTRIKYFSTVASNMGTAITLTQSSVNGDSFTINESGLYQVNGYFQPTAASTEGISINSTLLTTSIPLLSPANIIDMFTSTANFIGGVSWCGWLQAGSILRWHGSGDTTTTAANNKFEIVKIG